MKKIYLILTFLFVTAMLSACGNVQSQVEDDRTVYEDYSKEFDGLNGCAVFYDSAANTYTYYNKEMCENEYTPLSTFKIVATLSALENNVVTSPDDKMNYSGATYPIDFWNNDLTLRDAFKYSCVWYYRQLTDKIGIDNMQKTVNELNYGNKDISQWEGSGKNPIKELNGFWLGSSLKISPIEQVNSISYIFEGNNNFKEKNISLLKDIMLSDISVDNESIKVYGKTGTGYENEAWFVGFTEQCGFRNYFAIYLCDNTDREIAGADAKAIAAKIINNHFAE